MDLKPGTRLRSVTSDVEVIIVRPPAESVVIACGGAAMVAVGDPDPPTAEPEDGLGEPTLLGKRYVDDTAGLELLCTKGGAGSLTCEGRVMPLKDAKPLPSSD